MMNPRLTLPDLVYLAGPYDTPEQRTFNTQLADLARSYNFPMFVPQEAAERLSGESLRTECIEALDHSHLMLAVLYGETFDPATAFEVGYTLGRRHVVLAIQNLVLPPTLPSDVPPNNLLEYAVRTIAITPEKELSADRLVPIMNRYFAPPGLLEPGRKE